MAQSGMRDQLKTFEAFDFVGVWLAVLVADT
jgi:hypothetical protein